MKAFYWGLLSFCIFISTTAMGEAPPRCISLFESSGPRYNWKISSFLRFDSSVEKTPEAKNDLLAARWAKKVNQPISGFQKVKKWLGFKNQVHESIHLSPDHKYVVSKGSDLRIRIYHAESGIKVTEVELPKIFADLVDEVEVIHISNQHFVLAVEGHSKKLSDASMGIDRFYPTDIYLIDFSGQILGQQHISQVLKRTEVSVDNKYWFILTADDLIVENLEVRHYVTGYPIISNSISHFKQNDHFILQTFHFSKDNRYLMLAATAHRGAESKIIVYKNNADLFSRPEVVGIYQIDAKRIYKIDLVDDTHLKVISTQDTDEVTLEETIINVQL